MRRVRFLEELRQMRFEESYSGYRSDRLSQEEAAKILGGLQSDISPIYEAI